MRTSLGQADIVLYTYGKKVKSKRSIPNVDYVIDVDGLRDPLSNRGFKRTHADGRPGAIQDFVKEDPRVGSIVDTVKLLGEVHLRSKARDHAWISVALRDHHGRWIAPAVGEIVAGALDSEGYKVYLSHVDLEVAP